MNLYMFAQKDLHDNTLLDFGIDKEEIPRLRGIQVVEDKENAIQILHIHTRTGGGNRESYEEGNKKMQDNKFFVMDADDSFDSTYADWFFLKKDGDLNPVSNASEILNTFLTENGYYD